MASTSSLLRALALGAALAAAAAAAGGPCDGEACLASDDSALLQAGARRSRAHSQQPGPFPIAPCLPGEDCAPDSCSVFAEFPCEAAGWVFCQNAVCDDEPTVDAQSGRLVAKCHCWQPSNTNFSLLPVASNSGANCVMGAGPGGEEMCTAMQNGALFSTYGPTGSFLPGKPLETANCPPHTTWAWCWGAPCQREADGNITCNCPMMVSTNAANQTLSLVPSQCPSESAPEVNPCVVGIHNSMPAGSSTSDLLPDAPPPCYSFELGQDVQCPGSTTMCAGDQCCPRVALSDSKTFPCPTASPGWNSCEGTLR